MSKDKLLHICMIFVILISSLALSPAAGQSSRASSATIYVDVEATGNNDGTSWANAYVDLQPAMEATIFGDQVWVAAGTYLPTVEHCGTGDRYKSFQLKNGVAVYGGFEPTIGDVSWGDRDWVTNLVILSGGIGIPGDDSDNSIHVFCHEEGLNLDGSAILDGFTIVDGDSSGIAAGGAGMSNQFSSPTLTNLIFASNSTPSYGGGMTNYASSPILTNVTFTGNSAGYGGGGMSNFTSSPTLIGVTFTNNTANGGGGMYNQESAPNLIHVSFTNNSVNWWGGGGIYNDLSSPYLKDVTFSNNMGADGGGGVSNHSSSPTLIDVSFNNNSANSGGGMFNDTSHPILRNATFSDNSAINGGGMSNYGSSPTLANVTFSNNTAENGGGLYNEYYASPNLTNITFLSNSSSNSGSAIYNKDFTMPSLDNCILWDDTTDEIVNNNGSVSVIYSDVQGGYSGEGNLDFDPLLGPLADNGGYVMTHALGAGSPAIDTGNPDPATCPDMDARGGPRPLDGDENGTPRCDMGAYEFQLVPILPVAYLPLAIK